MAILIDTSVIADLERARQPLSPLRAAFGPDARLYVSSVVVAELLLGVELAESAPQRTRRSTFVEAVLLQIGVLPFGVLEARVHAETAAVLRSLGVAVGAHDLLIAATALAHDLPVATANAAEFGRIPGLRVISTRTGGA